MLRRFKKASTNVKSRVIFDGTIGKVCRAPNPVKLVQFANAGSSSLPKEKRACNIPAGRWIKGAGKVQLAVLT